MDPRRVLVVDDHREFARTLGDILRDHGASVRVATSAREALELVKREPFDALISDVVMHGMNGVELVREARLLVPGLPAVLMTGENPSAALAQMSLGEVLAVLPKPVPFRHLLDVLSSISARLN